MGGYTSYNSAHRMHRRSPTFAALARQLDRHVAEVRPGAAARSHRAPA
jgi:hypothetical protein